MKYKTAINRLMKKNHLALNGKNGKIEFYRHTENGVNIYDVFYNGNIALNLDYNIINDLIQINLI